MAGWNIDQEPYIPQDDPQPDNLLYEAWCVIANAPDAWSEDTEWRQAAIRWRDKWHATLAPSAPYTESE